MCNIVFLCIWGGNYDLESNTAADQTVAVGWNGEVKFHKIFSQLLSVGKGVTIPFTFIFSHDNRCEMSSCRWTVMTLTCHWWSTEWNGPLLLCLLSPLHPPHPPHCQLAAGSMSSNLRLSLRRHHSPSVCGPQVGSLVWSSECLRLKKKYWHFSCAEYNSHMGTSSCGQM